MRREVPGPDLLGLCQLANEVVELNARVGSDARPWSKGGIERRRIALIVDGDHPDVGRRSHRSCESDGQAYQDTSCPNDATDNRPRHSAPPFETRLRLMPALST